MKCTLFLFNLDMRNDVLNYNCLGFIALNYAVAYNLDPTNLIFQHDNDPKHTSNSVRH
jgi:hypothetical protein